MRTDINLSKDHSFMGGGGGGGGWQAQTQSDYFWRDLEDKILNVIHVICIICNRNDCIFRCPLGVDLTEEVEKACIRTSRLKLL